jgi:hypothetical protein
MEWYSIIVFFLLAGVIVILVFKLSKKEKPVIPLPEEETEDDPELEEFIPSSAEEFSEYISSGVLLILLKTKEVFSDTLTGLNEDDRELLKKSAKEVKKINKLSKRLKNQTIKTIKNLEKDLFVSGSYASQACDYLREATYCLNFITNPAYYYLNNVHNPLSDEYHQILLQTKERINILFLDIVKGIREKSIQFEKTVCKINEIRDILENESNARMVGIVDADRNTRTTMLYFGIIHETKNILFHLESFIGAVDEFEKTLRKPNLIVN